MLLKLQMSTSVVARMAQTFSLSSLISSLLLIISLTPTSIFCIREERLLANLEQISDDLDEAASNQMMTTLSTNSHRIVASGWPSTSQMWPSLQRADEKLDNTTSNWPDLMEPFIYADRPRSGDYSLLLSLNQTVLTDVKSHLKPMAVSLSFEYYFNYDQKITAPPGIKIEVDRKQLKYIEPNSESVRQRVWVKFNEAIVITDPSQFDNHDWLKLSLIIRQPLSLVAIRHLKVEFRMDKNQSPTTETPVTLQTTTETPPPPPLPQPSPVPISPTNNVTQAPTARQNLEENPISNNQDDTESSPNETLPAASNIVEDKVKQDKKSFPWNVIGRKKREVTSSANSTTDIAPELITMTCYQKDTCEWKSDLGSDQIQWSLARMPPSTETVASGYYYVSNMNNYGDLDSLLRITLNQTDSATIADQNSDHCIELAMFITERSQVKMYQLTRNSLNDEDPWIRGNLLLTWAPTIVTSSNGKFSRNSMPNTRLVAMEGGNSGWTYETLCFGDFYSDPRKCGLGLCALAFEMIIDSRKIPPDTLDPFDNQLEPGLQPSTIEQPESGAEQVVGVSLLREFTINLPIKTNRPKWLETWQLEEVAPTDYWKFYPKLDYKIEKNNISLLNLYNSAHYFIESDWMSIDTIQDLTASLAIDLIGLSDSGALNFSSITQEEQLTDQLNIFTLKINTNLVDANFSTITNDSSLIEWNIRNNNTLYNLSLPVTDHISAAWQGKLPSDNHAQNLFKIIIELMLDTHWITKGSAVDRLLSANNISYRITLANVSLSDRCYPNPCQHGACSQNGTGFEDWNCNCEDKYRGRRCEFARWCNISHVTPWVASDIKSGSQQITLKAPTQLLRQPKMAVESITRVSGREYCQRKLGSGSRCTDIDLPLNDNLYTEEDKTFICSCQEDYYLSDDSRCKQAHLCNSVFCSSIGMICDETKPFNRTQPCQCNEKQDWFPDPQNPANKCVRRQCHDKQHDCQFDAHVCLPTLPGERPICKCGPKFTLKEENGKKSCQSTACVLPTLNDCQQVCIPDNSNLEKPYRCECHRGFTLDADGRSCSVQRPHLPPHCKPSCNPETQICTDAGCKCKQGYIGEGEVKIRQVPKNRGQSGSSTNNTTDIVDYTQSIRCLNVCELTYAENKEEFELIESVCPLGLCDKTSFQCQCSDPSSSALINSKYEPIYANSSLTNTQATSTEGEEDSEKGKQRISPLCHLRRVCHPESSSFKICRSQGAICVPDYTKPAMFDCICPPSTDKKIIGHGTSSEFICEPKCESKKNECLRRQAVCKLIDKDIVKCDCLPGFMFNKQDQKCYLAKYSYAFNLLLVNKYYEPESHFYKVETLNRTEGTQLTESIENSSSNKLDPSELNHILPQYSQTQIKSVTKTNFITDYNRCNITQVIPKDVIEDPYEHNIESYLSYIEQCNEKIHQNVKNFHLNSRLGEDLRQSLRQHIRDFTVTTSNSSCHELHGSSGMYLNCTVYLQSNEPIPAFTVEYVLNDCDKNGHTEEYCWIKPRLLLKKPSQPNQATQKKTEALNQTRLMQNELNYRQIIPCDIDNFCGFEAISVRADDKTSLCSCKCPPDIEIIDFKDLEPHKHDDDPSKVLVKEICAPVNHCGTNSTFCLGKVGSVCHYDVRKGSICTCVYPSYEDNEGKCIEVTFSQLDSTLIVIIVMLGTGLIVSIAINLAVVAKSKNIFGRSKQYPLNEFPTARTNNRSTGVPNSAFSND